MERKISELKRQLDVLIEENAILKKRNENQRDQIDLLMKNKPTITPSRPPATSLVIVRFDSSERSTEPFKEESSKSTTLELDETHYTSLEELLTKHSILDESLPSFEPPVEYLDRIHERITRLSRVYFDPRDVRWEHGLVVLEELVPVLSELINKQERENLDLLEAWTQPLDDNLKCYSYSYSLRRNFHWLGQNFFRVVFGVKAENAIEELCAHLKLEFDRNQRNRGIALKSWGFATDGDYWYLVAYDGAKDVEVGQI